MVWLGRLGILRKYEITSTERKQFDRELSYFQQMYEHLCQSMAENLQLRLQITIKEEHIL
jgi:hypothetical protein